MEGMISGSVDPDAKAGVADPEVTAKAKWRRFSAQYKLRVLRDADTLGATGGVGELLRREGLYSSHQSMWRRERERGDSGGSGRRGAGARQIRIGR